MPGAMTGELLQACSSKWVKEQSLAGLIIAGAPVPYKLCYLG